MVKMFHKIVLAVAFVGLATHALAQGASPISNIGMLPNAANAVLPDAIDDLSLGPVQDMTMICTTTNASAVVTACNGTAYLAVGMFVTGPGIAAGTTVASGITATGFTMSAVAGAAAGTGLVSARGAFWSDIDGGTPKIFRLPGRLAVGGAIGILAARAGTYFTTCPTDTYCGKYSLRDAQLGVSSTVGGLAISGISRASGGLGIATLSPIGISGFLVNDLAGRNGHAMYGDVQHEAAADGQYAFGLELALKNQAGDYTSTAYTEAVGVRGIRLLGGGDNSYGGVAVNPVNVGLEFIHGGGAGTGGFNKGIIFGYNSLIGSDGTTGTTAVAMEMARGQGILWKTPSDNNAARIRSDVDTSGHDSSLIFDDNFVLFLGPSGANPMLRIAHSLGTTAVNNLKTNNGATGVAPKLSVEGTDTDINLQILPKGAGYVDAQGSLSATSYKMSGTPAFVYPTFESGTAGDTIAIGRSALGGTAPSSAAYQTVAIGALAMSGNGITTAAVKNTAVGYSAMAALTSGTLNTALGNGALAAITSGGNNVALGQGAGATFSTTNNTVSLGSGAMSAATGGASIGIGLNAANNQTGGTATAVGHLAGQFISSGSGNTAVGYLAMQGITGTRITGNNNTAIGQQAGLLLQGAAANNTMLGTIAGSSITTGTSNVVIGASVASTTLTTGANNVLIGTSSSITTAAAGTSNTIGIGAGSTAIWAVTGAGTPTTAVETFHGDIFFPEVTTGTNADTVCMAAGNKLTLQAAACTISSMRFKNLIGDYKVGGALDTIEKLTPIVFTMKPEAQSKSDPYRDAPLIGLSAENVAAIEPRCAVYEADGKTPKTYRQECMIAVLVAAVQAQQREIETLKARP